jgi:transketolase N-terminal domain/subunit
MRRRGYDEATLRLEYLDPMFAALGWNVWNNPPQQLKMIFHAMRQSPQFQ